MITPAADTLFLLLLLFGYAFGISLLISSVLRHLPGPRAHGVAVVPAAGGLAMLFALLLFRFDDTGAMTSRAIAGDLYPARLGVMESRLLAVAAIGGGFVVGEVLLVNTRAAIAGISRRLRAGSNNPVGRWEPDAAVSGLIALMLPMILVAASGIESRFGYAVNIGMTVQASYPLPGEPMGLAPLSATDGYISFSDGRIAYYRVGPDAGEFTIETVANDLAEPRGLAIADRALYVADAGPGLCEGLNRVCELDFVLLETERDGLESSSGSIVAFDIRPDGGLENRRVVLSGLPVATFRHALNTIAPGPDGYLYVSLGGVDVNLGTDPSLMQIIDRDDLDLLGTVLRVAPDGSNVEVFARGFRNVYDLEFDGDGALFAIDNDGPTARSLRLEEVMHITKGADYGYPYRGSFDDKSNGDGTLWYMEEIAAASGIEWAERAGLGPGLIVGSFGRIDYVGFSRDEAGYFVRGPGSLMHLMDVDGFVTAMEATDGGVLVATVYGSVVSPDDSLVVLAVNEATIPRVN